MSKRYRDAAAIQQGACNPIAIVNSLKSAIDELRAENAGTDEINGDMAVRAMVHQLAHLTSIQYFDQTAYEAMMQRVESGKVAEIKAQQALNAQIDAAVEANLQPVFGKKVPAGWDKIEADTPVFVKRALESYQYLPTYAKVAIERLDADSTLRRGLMLETLLESYAKTYGMEVEDHIRASAHHICLRRFPDYAPLIVKSEG
jgi:hypothetical protein